MNVRTATPGAAETTRPVGGEPVGAGRAGRPAMSKRPARPRRRKARRVFVAVAVVALVVLLGWLVWWSPVLAVREVRVLGNRTVPADALREAAGVPTGIPLARVPADDVLHRMLEIPAVRGAEVRYGWPGTLVLVVTERTPVARVGNAVTDVTSTTLDPSSSTSTTGPDSLARGPYLIDDTGVGYRAVGSGDPAQVGLPTVDAPPQSWPSVAAALVALPEPIRTKVQKVSAESAEDVQLVLRSGTRVRWGGAADGARKAQIAQALLAGSPAVIDVSAPELPTTRGHLGR